MSILKVVAPTNIAAISISQITPLRRLVISAGESNATGGASIIDGDISAGELAARNLQILNNTSLVFEDLDVGTNQEIGDIGTTGDNSKYGFCVSLANMYDAGRLSLPTYLVQAAHYSQPISKWDVDDPSGVWDLFVERVDAAVTALEAIGDPFSVDVALSIGINDSFLATDPSTFEASLNSLIFRMREQIGYPTRFFAMTFAVPDFSTGWDAMNEAIENVCVPSNKTVEWPTNNLTQRPARNAVYPNTPLQVDLTHLNHLGHMITGERWCDLAYGASGTLPTPTFSVTPGSYGTSQNVTVSCSEGGATLRYTLDGSNPHSASTEVSGAISIASSCQLRVVAQKAGWANSYADGYYSIGTATEWSLADRDADSAAPWLLENASLDALNLGSNGSDWSSIRSSTGKTTGKWYIELVSQYASAQEYYQLGFANAGFSPLGHTGQGSGAFGVHPSVMFYDSGLFTDHTSNTGLSGLAGNGTVTGLCLDMDNGRIYIAKNNVYHNSGDPANGTGYIASFNPASTGTLFLVWSGLGTHGPTYRIQATGGSQTYSPPSGFTAWG